MAFLGFPFRNGRRCLSLSFVFYLHDVIEPASQSYWFDRAWHDDLLFSMNEGEWETMRGIVLS